MIEFLARDCIDCCVKIWSILYFSEAMERQPRGKVKKTLSMGLFIAFVMMQRYLLYRQTLGEAFVRNIVLFALTCLVMLCWRKGQTQYLIFLASIVFFLWGGWLKLFSPTIFASLHLPTFGVPLRGSFPALPVTLAENACRITVTILLKRYAFDISPERRISAKEGFLALVPAIIDHTTVLILYYLTIVAPSSQADGISMELTLLTLMLVFGMPCMLAATEQRFQLQRKELALVRMESQMKQQVQEFENRRISDEYARRMYHDFAGHLRVLKEMQQNQSDTKEAAAYVSELLTRTENVQPAIHTGNPVLDTLLSQKKDECTRKGIALSCMVDFRNTEFIRYGEIVTMFSNILDNAIEAVEAMPEEQRQISLSAGLMGGYVVVKCQNPFTGTLEKRQDGLLNTSKAEKERHGIGLGNLRRIVESYQGILNIEQEDGQFVVQWMIPLPVEV